MKLNNVQLFQYRRNLENKKRMEDNNSYNKTDKAMDINN